MPPKVVVPFTRLHPITKAVLDSYNLNVEYVRLDGEHDYGLLLGALWKAREPVVIVEHDIVPYPRCIEELHECIGQWCSCAYAYNSKTGPAHMLGCTKLSPELMEALPNLWDEPCHWSLCDQRLFFAAREVGQEPHRHRPDVVHLHGIA